ncbi:hypothetical protein LKP36_004266 [Salmonella enterica]|nr:hypothetical protein [Salmonella enterica]
MSSPLPSSFWCRNTLVILSLFALSACTFVSQPQRSLPVPDKQTCDVKTGVCHFSWEVWRESPSNTGKSPDTFFTSGSSSYPIDKVTSVPFALNDGDDNQFALIFEIVSSGSSKFSVVTLTGNIRRGSDSSSFTHKLTLPTKGTHVRARVGDESFVIYIYPPTFTP